MRIIFEAESAGKQEMQIFSAWKVQQALSCNALCVLVEVQQVENPSAKYRISDTLTSCFTQFVH